jgi:hypothetical protein
MLQELCRRFEVRCGTSIIGKKRRKETKGLYETLRIISDIYKVYLATKMLLPYRTHLLGKMGRLAYLLR